MNVLADLQKWYQSQCDGIWEHSHGLTIGTLDNPGWSVEIDLADTELANRPFNDVQRLAHETDWIHCRVRDQKFEGHSGPFKLDEILQIFLAWAAEKADAA